MRTKEEILGKGWEFPPRFDKNALAPSMLAGEADVINSIDVIINTKLGERIMRGGFGSTIHELVFEPLNANMKTYMASALKIALNENEPRIIVDKIQLSQPDLSLGLVEIDIQYTFVETKETKNIVVPYNIDRTNIL